jgi:predicted transposase/invertase (TIGR01784 family)
MGEVTYEPIQANHYDKIVKENMEAILPAFTSDVLKIDVINSLVMPGEIQHTTERKPDLITRITTRDNQIFLLHLEWQSNNDKNMVYRMAEYAVILYRKYHLPVEQFVIFMGNGNVTMKRTIQYKNLKFRYHIISLKNIDYRFFLKSKNPGLKVLAILGNFEKDGDDEAVENIVRELCAAVGAGLERDRHFKQLQILVGLRNNNVKLKLKKMISTSRFLKVEKGLFYKEGYQAGKIKGEVRATKKFIRILKELGHEAKVISKKLNIPIEEIEKNRLEATN